MEMTQHEGLWLQTCYEFYTLSTATPFQRLKLAIGALQYSYIVL
jgi:hypothetical protein